MALAAASPRYREEEAEALKLAGLSSQLVNGPNALAVRPRVSGAHALHHKAVPRLCPFPWSIGPADQALMKAEAGMLYYPTVPPRGQRCRSPYKYTPHSFPSDCSFLKVSQDGNPAEIPEVLN